MATRFTLIGSDEHGKAIYFVYHELTSLVPGYTVLLKEDLFDDLYLKQAEILALKSYISSTDDIIDFGAKVLLVEHLHKDSGDYKCVPYSQSGFVKVI